MIVVMKVTHNCNLRCKYCYMPLKNTSSKMTLSVVRAVIDKIGGFYRHVDYSWHGGEPLLAGISFYKQVLQEQAHFYSKYPNKKFKNSLQTNGILMTNEWFEFLMNNSFNLGFSYDGPGDANRLRYDINGNQIGVKLGEIFFDLKKKYDYSPGIISVVSHANVDQAHEIYYHFKDLGIESFSLLPYLGEMEELRINANEFFNFHKEIFDLWVDDETPFKRITPLTQIISSFLSKDRNICSWDGRCFKDLISIDPDGRVFICSAFHKQDHCIGNILHDPVEGLFSNLNHVAACKAQESVLEKCANCDVFDFCRGGCREAAYNTFGSMDMADPRCNGRRKLIKHILSRFYDAVKAA